MINDVEMLILSELLHDDEYARRVLPHIDSEYFESRMSQNIFEIAKNHIEKYDSLPTKQSISIDINNIDTDLSDKEVANMIEAVKLIEKPDATLEWAIDETEKFCKDRAVYNALMQSVRILEDDTEGTISKNGIPDILSKALAVDFNTNIGHDYILSAQERFEYYHKIEDKIPLGIKVLTKITNGGFSKKTINIFMAGTGVGKTLLMTQLAGHAYLKENKNVLYITMEMAEERIAERLDSNMMSIQLDQLVNIPKSIYDARIDKLEKSTTGSLVIKEYPTAGAHVGHFKHLLYELRIKKQFIPDIIFVDYLNICASSRTKKNVGQYEYVKSIAEELRGLAVEHDVPIVTATQLNRSGFVNSDPGLEDTSESFGVPATADFVLALVTNDQLEELNQIMAKQLKNRYGDMSKNKKFILGINKSKMTIYDLDDDISVDNIYKDPVEKLDNVPIVRQSTKKKVAAIVPEDIFKQSKHAVEKERLKNLIF